MRSPVPILLLVHRLDLGGSERQMTEVAKSIDRSRFEPHVGCFHAEGLRATELQSAGVPVLHLPVTSFASFSAISGAVTMIRYIRKNRIQLVHSFDVPLNIFAVPVARLSRQPAVVSSQRAHRLLTPGLYHRLLRITDSMVDGNVVNCEYMRQHLIEEERVPAEQIHLCYNGIDTRIFHPMPAERPLALKGASIVIGVVCALRPEKGLATLVEAFSRFVSTDPRAKLVVVGSGPGLSDLRAQADFLNISDLCLFVPATNAVPSWLSLIDIFVLPSLSEALSNSLMEAMACGCCVAASRVGGNPELIGNSERGLLFEAGNALELAGMLRRLVGDPELRHRLSNNAKGWIREKFALPVSIGRMQQIYTELLSGGR